MSTINIPPRPIRLDAIVLAQGLAGHWCLDIGVALDVVGASRP